MVSFAYHNRSDAIRRQALSGRDRNCRTVSINCDAAEDAKIQLKPVSAAQQRPRRHLPKVDRSWVADQPQKAIFLL
jgi:hypothetical protein